MWSLERSLARQPKASRELLATGRSEVNAKLPAHECLFRACEFVVFRSSRLRTRGGLQLFFANAISQMFKRRLCQAKISHRESVLLQLLPYSRRDSDASPVFVGL